MSGIGHGPIGLRLIPAGSLLIVVVEAVEMSERLLIWAIFGFVAILFLVGLLFTWVRVPDSGPIPVEPLALSEEEQTLLLELARWQLEEVLAGRPAITVDPGELPENLKREAACFVSLINDESLRGCMIDAFRPHEPLYQNVLRNAVLAATGDERFPPVSANELPSIRIQISVITPPQPLVFHDPEDLLAKLTPGVDGVILTTATGLSTYLPMVWDQFPDPEVFLSRLCEKQGAAADCWRAKPPPQVEIYHAIGFSEDDTVLHRAATARGNRMSHWQLRTDRLRCR